MPAGRVVVAGLGPAGPELLTAAVTDAIGRIPWRFLRTARHPSAAAVGAAISFDDVYDAAATFDEVYATIVERLVAAAAEHGEVLYAVPGSPSVAERTVELLRAAAAEGRVELRVLPALSFLDLAWDRLGVDPLDAGVRLVDATCFAAEAAGERGPLLVAQCFSRAVLSDVKVSVDTDGIEGPRVTVLQRLGLPDEAVFEVAWDDLDRAVTPDHLTSVYIPTLAAPVAGELVRLVELMRALRTGCPWDAEQTHESLARYAVEEAYELAEAVDRLDADGASGVDHLVEELGDVLFQVVFHAAIAAEEGWFTLADVARVVHDKLVHRHPHVFPRDSFDASDVVSPDDVVRNWEQIKGGSSIPGNLPALAYASKVVKRAEAAGVPVPAVSSPPADAAALGERLLGVVAAARRAGLDAEVALRTAAARLRDHLGPS